MNTGSLRLEIIERRPMLANPEVIIMQLANTTSWVQAIDWESDHRKPHILTSNRL